MVYQCINIRQVPREVLKTEAGCLGFHTSLGTWRMLMLIEKQNWFWMKYDQVYTRCFPNVFVKFVIYAITVALLKQCVKYGNFYSRPRWLSWMRRPTGDQEVAGSTPAKVGNILSWRLIMKYFLRSFSPFR